ncbi:hypothetical protein HanRHA438_Chr11g0508331 [Helianthus annuus]|nr:hypothetical protein HanRHA438_Chr11g0508331 [Helianthus annuus]
MNIKLVMITLVEVKKWVRLTGWVTDQNRVTFNLFNQFNPFPLLLAFLINLFF